MRRTHPGAIRSLVAAVFVSAVLSFQGPASAFADDPVDATARRMDDRLFFVQSLSRGWEPLLTDFEVTLASLGDGDRTPVLKIRDTAAERYADLRAGDGTEAGEKRAFSLYDLLARDAVVAARRTEFALKAATIELKWADRAEKRGDDEGALKLALSAAKRSPGFQPAYDMIARLGIKQAEKAEARDDFYAALDVLTQSTQLLPETTPARAKLDQKRSQILATTGEVGIEWLGAADRMAKVRGPKTDFASAQLEFRPLAGQKAPPQQQAGRPMRLRNGRYEVVARGNGPAEFRAGQIDLTSQGASVTLVAAVPANMVIVPATGGEDAFLIDRTEVTVSEFRSPGTGNLGGDRTAASGVNWQQATAYAAASGKELPTIRQWFTAAFGDPDGKGRRYPWGDTTPQSGTHFVGAEGIESPQSVDSCAAGASRFGCVNMAGNVYEWLADERFIGSSFKRGDLKRDIAGPDDNTASWSADLLRDPVPSFECWNRMQPADRTRHFNHHAREDGATYTQVGLRCVVPLGKPRRNP
ncbi:MAG: formylglycine-generating enzyme family protein [Planctomycetes bacterium]|nr:formylglycine-generating enzyme family protein [Planctomycetota bacterium]